MPQPEIQQPTIQFGDIRKGYIQDLRDIVDLYSSEMATRLNGARPDFLHAAGQIHYVINQSKSLGSVLADAQKEPKTLIEGKNLQALNRLQALIRQGGGISANSERVENLHKIAEISARPYTGMIESGGIEVYSRDVLDAIVDIAARLSEESGLPKFQITLRNG